MTIDYPVINGIDNDLLEAEVRALAPDLIVTVEPLAAELEGVEGRVTLTATSTKLAVPIKFELLFGARLRLNEYDARTGVLEGALDRLKRV